MEGQSIYRRGTLARQNTQDTTVINFETPSKKEANHVEVTHHNKNNVVT